MGSELPSPRLLAGTYRPGGAHRRRKETCMGAIQPADDHGQCQVSVGCFFCLFVFLFCFLFLFFVCLLVFVVFVVVFHLYIFNDMKLAESCSTDVVKLICILVLFSIHFMRM